MRAGKKPSLKTDKKHTALGSKPGVSGYSKKASLLEDAITQMNAGKYGRSSAALKELLALDPQNMEARRLFATLHLRLGSLLPARQAFESLANEALERQDYWLAESLLQEYLAAGPRCVPFIEKLGIVYQEKGDELAAAEEFGKAIDILLEDPDTERPNWPTQLYAKIRDLAPASPPAFRLASFFDAQSGELLARPSAAHVELSEPALPQSELLETATPEATPDPVSMPEPISGVMPWDQVGEKASSVSPLSHHDADAAPLESDPTGIGSTSPTDTSSSAFGESVSNVARSEPAQSQIESGLEAGSAPCPEHSPEVPCTDITAAGESAAAPTPTFSASDEPAFHITRDAVATDAPLFPVAEEPPSLQSDQATTSAPAPMPWDQVQDGTVTIPPAEARIEGETPLADAVVPEPPAAAASEAPWSYGVGDRRASQDVEKTADSVSAPMPWEQIQDATVTIPQAEAVSGVETRSDSSVATESPFVALSDAVQVESQGETVPVWTTPEAAAARLDALSTDLPLDVSPQSLPVWEPAVIGDAAARSAGQLADVPPPAVVEPIPIPAPWEPAQESPANQADSPPESASSEPPPSISLPVEAQAAPFSEAVHQALSSEPSSLASEPSTVEEPASASTPVSDSGPLPENPPVPERIEKPRGAGFSWESIFSTWKYGPSSSKAKGYHAVPVDRHQTGTSLPPAPPAVQPAAYEAASPAVHGVSAAEVASAATIPPESVASPLPRNQTPEISVAIPSTESWEPDSAAVLAAAPGSLVEEGIPDSAAVLDQLEALVTPSPAIRDAIEPAPVDPSPVVEFGAQFEAATADMAVAPAPAIEPTAGIELPLVSPAQEASSLEPSVQSEELRVIAPDDAASSAQTPIATSEPALTREILPALQTPVNQLTGAAKESPVVSPAAETIEPMPPAPETVEKPEVATPIVSAPSIAPSSPVTESAQVSPQDADQPDREASVGVPDEEPVPLPVVLEVEPIPAIEPALSSQDRPEVAGAILSEPRPLPPQEKEEWVKTGESIRLIEPEIVQKAETAAPAAQGSEEPGASTVVSAVEVLFQSSERMTRTQTSERSTGTKPRPQIGVKLARLRLSVSAFIGSCFSTTQALVMSLVGLVVLMGAVVAIAIGAVGVIWVVMEEKPSSAFQRLTAAPQRSPMDARKNGYLLLLGFDAEAGADPIQAGHERKPGLNEDEAVAACLGGADGRSGGGPLNATASVADGWFRSSNPVAQFKTKADGLKGWIGQAQSSMGRYRQWLKMPFEDWGYGQAVAPPCASILFAHRLYVAEGFAQGQPGDAGIHRLQDDMEAWRATLGQAKTLPVKMLAVQAIQDDLSVASGLLAQPDFDSQALPVLSNLLRPLDQVESSMRWPMQSELAAAGPATDAQLKEDHGDDAPWHAVIAQWLPLPKQRRLNEYAEYYDASSKAAGEGRHSAMPKRATYVKNPPATVMDYLSNPIENIVGLKPLPSWDRYNGMVIDADVRLRLASVQAWLRRGSHEGDLVTRIAKAGQRFYDPYTGMPLLVNLKRGVLYSVGHDGKDQDADPQQDVVVSIPVDPPSSGSAKAASGSVKPK